MTYVYFFFLLFLLTFANSSAYTDCVIPRTIVIASSFISVFLLLLGVVLYSVVSIISEQFLD